MTGQHRRAGMQYTGIGQATCMSGHSGSKDRWQSCQCWALQPLLQFLRGFGLLNFQLL